MIPEIDRIIMYKQISIHEMWIIFSYYLIVQCSYKRSYEIHL